MDHYGKESIYRLIAEIISNKTNPWSTTHPKCITDNSMTVKHSKAYDFGRYARGIILFKT